MENSAADNILNGKLSQIDRLFPFHFILDKKLVITRLGPVLAKILNNVNALQTPFDEHFRILKPGFEIAPDFKKLSRYTGRFVLIAFKGIHETLLRGQFEKSQDKREIVFLGTLRIEDPRSMKNLGITYSDFPPYDTLFDIHQIKSFIKKKQESRFQAEEEQRELIGRDLHDGVGQMLAYLSVYFNLLVEKDRIEKGDIEKAQSTIRRMIDEVRRLARNLAPPTIKELGFRESILELINSYSIIPKPIFRISMYKEKDHEGLLHEHKLMIYRILQELSSNTFKYANANKVEIKIDQDPHELTVKYKDDGVGFNPKTVKKGLGIKSILSRVEFYGGNLILNSSPGNGTEVIISIPFES